MMNFIDFCKGFYRKFDHFLFYAGYEDKLEGMNEEDKRVIKEDVEMVESGIIMFAAGAVATLIVFIVIFGFGCIAVWLCDIFESIIPLAAYFLFLIVFYIFLKNKTMRGNRK